ncbi:MAG TPA: MAPEG family protein, partial [Sphingomicrobium sp.]
QPTIFYAIVFVLVLMRLDVPINVYLAWGYVLLRIVHSIVQATVNIVRIRFTLFALATLCLVALTLHAAMFILGH